MSENPEITPTRKGFVSPLERAQAGRIGGGGQQPQKQKNVETLERQNTSTLQRYDAETSENGKETEKKSKREETHFRQTVWMPKALNRRLKIHAAKVEEDISGIINKLVEEYLNREED